MYKLRLTENEKPVMTINFVSIKEMDEFLKRTEIYNALLSLLILNEEDKVIGRVVATIYGLETDIVKA